MAKVGEPVAGGCRLWLGATDRCGYGVVAIGPHRHKAHRVAWALENGPIPDGLSVLHRCDVPACVEPGHLFLGTAADNARDMGAKGRAPATVAARRREALELEERARAAVAAANEAAWAQLRERAAELLEQLEGSH